MPRHLLLLRHAKSAWDTPAESDFDRPLAKRGRHEAPRIGTWMKEQGLVPDQIISSPALRARQTTEAVCERLGLDKERISWEQRIYAAGVDSLLAAIGACPATSRTLLLVGHNPGLEELLVFLADAVETPASGKLLPTAALAELRIPGKRWQGLTAGSARLRRIMRPRDLQP